MSRPRITIPLSQAVTVLGQRHEALTLRRPRGRDVRATMYAGNDLEVGHAFLARLTGTPVDVIRALDPADLDRLTASADALMPRGW